jgi:hypothetical protein
MPRCTAAAAIRCKANYFVHASCRTNRSFSYDLNAHHFESGYGYEPAPAYGYGPGHYAAPAVDVGIGVGGYRGGPRWLAW